MLGVIAKHCFLQMYLTLRTPRLILKAEWLPACMQANTHELRLCENYQVIHSEVLDNK